MRSALNDFKPDVVTHLAAESQLRAQRAGNAARLPQLQRRRNSEQNSLGRQRFFQEIERAELRRFHRVGETRPATHHDYREIRRDIAQPAERRHSVELAWHHEVDERDVGLSLPHPGDCFDSARRFRYFVAFTREQRADHAPNAGLIVGDEDNGHLCRAIGR